MIYRGSSALVKRLFQEPESGALSDWLLARPELLKLTSQLSVIEVVGACRRHPGGQDDRRPSPAGRLGPRAGQRTYGRPGNQGGRLPTAHPDSRPTGERALGQRRTGRSGGLRPSTA